MEGSHQGYDGFVHTRSVLFVRDHFGIVSDLVVPEDQDLSNTFEQTWHYLPDANLSMDERTLKSTTHFEKKGNIQVAPAYPNTITKASKVEG